MRFWVPTALGFVALLTLVCASMYAPTLMMNQHVDDMWMREPVLASLAIINPVAVTAFLALVTWLDSDVQ